MIQHNQRGCTTEWSLLSKGNSPFSAHIHSYGLTESYRNNPWTKSASLYQILSKFIIQLLWFKVSENWRISINGTSLNILLHLQKCIFQSCFFASFALLMITIEKERQCCHWETGNQNEINLILFGSGSIAKHSAAFGNLEHINYFGAETPTISRELYIPPYLTAVSLEWLARELLKNWHSYCL